MMLTLYTGAARADAVRLGWQNVREGRLVYRRRKTRKQKEDVVIDIRCTPTCSPNSPIARRGP